MELQIINTSIIFTSIRKSFLLLTFGFTIISCSAQIKPYGSVKVDKDVYFDETEVDVGSWLSYYTWVLGNYGYNAALKVLPDSTAITPELWSYISNQSPYLLEDIGRYTSEPIGFFKKPFKENKTFGIRTDILEYRKLLDMPITGLTYEQVVNFCKWRSIHFAAGKFTFRLPTVSEWKNFALKGLSDKETINGCRDSLVEKKCNCPLFNYSYDKSQVKINTIGSYPSQKSGGFEVFGNVSEMTAEKGDARGGNYLLNARQCHIDSIQHYNKAESWLGFRCIAVKNLTKISICNVNQNKNNSQTKDTISNDGKFGLFTDIRDSKNYRTVKIGKQTWMAENLAYKPEVGDYWAYENNEKYVSKYGYLYTLATARKVAPKGWHLPTKDEYEILLKVLKSKGENVISEILNGNKNSFSAVFVGTCSGLFHKDLCTVYDWTAFWAYDQKDEKDGFLFQVGPIEVKLLTTKFINDGYPIRCVKD